MDKKRKIALRTFAEENGIAFNDFLLLDKALTHPTYVFESKKRKLESNQRLEFLGDAVLGMLVAQHLYETYPKEPEGTLTKMRAFVVCEATLAKIAKSLDLGQLLNLGKGEELTGGRERTSNLADAFESLIGALYLDQGMEAVKALLERGLIEELDAYDASNYGDYKTMVQEIAQREFGENVSYQILSESGPDHQKRFESGIYLKNKLLAKGSGLSKKEAEQRAAKKALVQLEKKDAKENVE